MAVVLKPDASKMIADKAALGRILDEVDARAGIVPNPNVTVEELIQRVRESMAARGIRPEDNIGTRELMRMRYGDNWEEELKADMETWAEEDRKKAEAKG